METTNKSPLTPSIFDLNGGNKPRSFSSFVFNGVQLNSSINILGTDYNPSNPKISSANVIIIQANIYDKQKVVIVTENAEKDFLLARHTGYLRIHPLCTGVMNALIASENVTPEQIRIAKGKYKVVKGIRAKTINIPKPSDASSETPEEQSASLDTIRRNSVSFQEMGVQLMNFYDFIDYVTTQSCYSTNDDDFKAANLNTFYDNLDTFNTDAENAKKATELARNERNLAFFHNQTGARFLYTQVKSYFKSTFGSKSSKNKMVSALAFPNLIPKKKRTPETKY